MSVGFTVGDSALTYLVSDFLVGCSMCEGQRIFAIA